MTIGALVSVLLSTGIEVPAGSLEVRWIALGILVDMDGMLARRQVFQVHLDFDSSLALLEHNVTGILAVCGLDGNFHGLGSSRIRRKRQSSRGRQHCSQKQFRIGLHRVSPSAFSGAFSEMV
jgi:hypothetical protein